MGYFNCNLGYQSTLANEKAAETAFVVNGGTRVKACIHSYVVGIEI